MVIVVGIPKRKLQLPNNPPPSVLFSTIDGTALEEEQIEKDLEAEASSTNRRGSVRARRRSTKAKITLEDGEEIITEITV